MASLTYFSLFIFLGIAPSLIWLLFYLRQDARPEPKKMVIKIFFYGIIFALFALLLELGFKKIFALEKISILFAVFYFVFFVGFVEEFSKYLAVRVGVTKNSALDEPVDLMIYMIIAALGFAALENVLIFIMNAPFPNIGEVVVIFFGRFLMATFLHTIASGILGYFLAISFLKIKQRKKFLIIGIALASLLHGFYNLSIISIEGTFAVKDGAVVVLNKSAFIGFLFFLKLLLLVSAVFLFKGFAKLKKLKSVCLLN